METTQNQINELTDRVSALTAQLTAVKAEAALVLHTAQGEMMRANRAEAELASLKQLDRARRKLLAQTMIALLDLR